MPCDGPAADRWAGTAAASETARSPPLVRRGGGETASAGRPQCRIHRPLALSSSAGSMFPGRMRGTWGLGRSPAEAEIGGRYGRGGGLVPGESHGGQFVADQVQVPEIDVRVGPGECEPVAGGVEGDVLDRPVQAGNVNHGLEVGGSRRTTRRSLPPVARRCPSWPSASDAIASSCPLSSRWTTVRSGSARAIKAPSESPTMTRLVRVSTTSRVQPSRQVDSTGRPDCSRSNRVIDAVLETDEEVPALVEENDGP